MDGYMDGYYCVQPSSLINDCGMKIEGENVGV